MVGVSLKSKLSAILIGVSSLLVSIVGALAAGGVILILLRALRAQDAELSSAVFVLSLIVGHVGSRPRSFIAAARSLPLIAKVTAIVVSALSAMFLGHDPWSVRFVRLFVLLAFFFAFLVVTHRSRR